jgi:hypothetical protein
MGICSSCCGDNKPPSYNHNNNTYQNKPFQHNNLIQHNTNNTHNNTYQNKPFQHYNLTQHNTNNTHQNESFQHNNLTQYNDTNNYNNNTNTYSNTQKNKDISTKKDKLHDLQKAQNDLHEKLKNNKPKNKVYDLLDNIKTIVSNHNNSQLNYNELVPHVFNNSQPLIYQSIVQCYNSENNINKLSHNEICSIVILINLISANINNALLTYTNNTLKSPNCIKDNVNPHDNSYLLYLATALKKLKVTQNTHVYFYVKQTAFKDNKFDICDSNEMAILTLCSFNEHDIINETYNHEIICKASVLTYYYLKNYFNSNNNILLLPGTKFIITNKTTKYNKLFIELMEVGNEKVVY